MVAAGLQHHLPGALVCLFAHGELSPSTNNQFCLDEISIWSRTDS